jgi:actin-related protein 10
MTLDDKSKILNILFNDYKMESVSFIPSPLLSLMTTGKTSGIIVDVGHNETVIVPVF